MTFHAKLPKLEIEQMRNFKRINFPSFASRIIIRLSFLKLNLFALTYLLLFISIVSLYVVSLSKTTTVKQILGESVEASEPDVDYLQIYPTTEPELTLELTPTPTQAPTTTPTPQISNVDTTKTIEDVNTDNTMATANEIFNALNSYRNEKGIVSLSWDNTLANFAQGRVNTFAVANNLDDHAGFRSYMENGGFEASGFNGLGENSAQLAGPMSGEEIIREIYGASSAHNTSQLDPSWTHAGVAVNGNFVNVNFGRR